MPKTLQIQMPIFILARKRVSIHAEHYDRMAIWCEMQAAAWLQQHRGTFLNLPGSPERSAKMLQIMLTGLWSSLKRFWRFAKRQQTV